ncbi:hypothetical protein LTR64_004762 [Lithohypha guttulata]|uniref:uncharacterized protein n=1 Tax=Lithohypha guttulata TaxID=1690604 RepID=UPI002DDFEF4F|nr:hypothetical protein LTR51_005941 [Lithohypha guttulata]
MSSRGLREDRYSPDHRLSGGWIVQAGEPSNDSCSDVVLQSPIIQPQRPRLQREESYGQGRPPKRARTQFYDFAAQVQLQQHHQRRKRYLSARKRVLQKSIALSARLRRTSSWVQDGLVEISKHQDTRAFAQVFSHAQDLVDVCISHWNNDLNNLDTVQSSDTNEPQTTTPQPFFDQLPVEAQKDLLELLSNLRCNPRFLIDRLSNLPRSQVATLTSSPRWQFSDVVLKSFSQDSNRSGSQRRRQLQEYSKKLEDYATSFERENPLSFLIHNLYSHDVRPESSESRLRLYTWSTTCAELFQNGVDSYIALCGQALDAFSITQDWPAKLRMELFLMDILQKGAFLLNDTPIQRGQPGYNPLKTEQARKFFDDAVLELYWTLIDCRSGCYPSGALALAQAILGKLSSQDHQGFFRNHFFREWYLGHFLRTAIMYPENENMLLQMHVSKRARDHILAPIYNRFLFKFDNHLNPTTDQDTNIRNIIEDMISMLEGLPAPTPYEAGPEPSPATSTAATVDMLVVSASEVIKVLEILSPQTLHPSDTSDPVLREIGNAFRSTYSRPTTRFDILKRQLQLLIEPGISAKDIHPCSETWTDFAIAYDGRVHASPILQPVKPFIKLFESRRMPLAQQAALRLCASSLEAHTNDDGASSLTRWSETSSLTELFQDQIDKSQAEMRTVDSVYWKKALTNLTRLQQRFSFGNDATNDTFILFEPLQHLAASREEAMNVCASLEDQLGLYETSYQSLKKQVKAFMSTLEGLRLKLWYTSQVVNSEPYQDARNITSALSNMAISTMTNLSRSSRDQARPSTSQSSRSSIFEGSQTDIMKLLKAPTEHGGPRKLADEQIDSINNWLQQYSIDNFCIGEERLHRFCMEIQLVTKRLTGETMIQSPELWSSELFNRERLSYDIQTVNINSAPASLRPASVYSDSLSATFPVSRSPMRSSDSDARSIMSDERSSIRRGSVYGLFQQRLDPRLLTPGLASSIGSHGRNSSANTTTSEIFTPSQSVTSASVYSRPPSMLYGRLPDFGARPAFSLKEKKKFRDKLRKGLICLLLSDLGSLVWSWGCETDKWIGDVQLTPSIEARCKRRLATNSLFVSEKSSTATPKRRQSTTDASLIDSTNWDSNQTSDSGYIDEDVDFRLAIEDILIRLSKQIDPISKLQACVDFHALSTNQLNANSSQKREVKEDRKVRRRSLDTDKQDEVEELLTATNEPSLTESVKPSEGRIIAFMKCVLATLKPLTIFRDLQFIAAFAPAEMLDKTAAGKAFMNLGMSALEYKKELCGSMVDVADQVVAADAIERVSAPENEQVLAKAAEYWKIAAREGNAAAQRELALLYLMHPGMLPVVTMPLSTTADIFKDEMMWQKTVRNNDNKQALCLALHWMQLAAANRDEVAQQKMRERNGQRLSIR